MSDQEDQAPEVRRVDGGRLSVRSKVGPPDRRRGYENQFFRGTEVGLDGWHRAHSQGAGTGWESRDGICYAPEEVNLAYQNQGIEDFIRTAQSQKRDGVDLYLTTVTERHPGTLRLKSIEYKLEAVESGKKPATVFEGEIGVENTRDRPKITAIAESYHPIETYLKPAETRIGGSSPKPDAPKMKTKMKM